jgi:thiamine-phosphate pyrophosphorylase
MSVELVLSAVTKGLLRDGPALMVVTDPSIPDLEARLDDAITGGVRCIQYRDKGARSAERVMWTQRFKASHPDVILLVNDDMAPMAEGADGLHMSGGYEALSDARVGWAWKPLIGRSVQPGYREPDLHYRPGVDYVAFGTVFPSASHPRGPVAGLAALAESCRDTNAWGVPFTCPPLDTRISGVEFQYHPHRPLPVLAIGGVTAQNAGDCIRAGAAGVAVIRSVLMAKDPARAAADILHAMREAKK